MEGIRAAASFEGLIILGVIYLVLNLLSQAGKKAGRTTQPPPPEPDEATGTQQEALSLEAILRQIEKAKEPKPAARQPAAAPRRLPEPPHPLPEVKRPAPPPRRPVPSLRRKPQAPMRPAPSRQSPERGPLGRPGTHRREGAEEVEDRRSLEGHSLEVEESLEVLDETRLRPPRPERDFDDEAEGIIARRLTGAERRNQQHVAADHADFHARIEHGEIGSTDAADQADARRRTAKVGQLRQAVIWSEILGPPRSTEL